MRTSAGTVARLALLNTTGVLFLAVCIAAQTADSSKTDAKQPPAEKFSGSIEVFGDTMGVDFGPYLGPVAHDVRNNWYRVIPESARFKHGRVSIDFVVLKDGLVSGMRLFRSSGDVGLDRAAWGAISGSNPFKPLPAEFTGPYLALRFSFYYNPDAGDAEITPSRPVKMLAGTTQQFSVSAILVTWAIVGDQCAKTDCGHISPAGLYTAPTALVSPLNIQIKATHTSPFFESYSTQVTVAPAASAK
jgi:TonB family protein